MERPPKILFLYIIYQLYTVIKICVLNEIFYHSGHVPRMICPHYKFMADIGRDTLYCVLVCTQAHHWNSSRGLLLELGPLCNNEETRGYKPTLHRASTFVRNMSRLKHARPCQELKLPCALTLIQLLIFWAILPSLDSVSF